MTILDHISALRGEVIRTSILDACWPYPHPVLARKSFLSEHGLVCEGRRTFVATGAGDAMAHALPPLDWPDLIVPGRIEGHLATLQTINAASERRMLRSIVMVGAAHRFAMGRETWVAEEIATALSIRAALRFLGRSTTVLLDFAASNVARVAKAGPVNIAANHDAPYSHLGDPGAGEYCGRQSGRIWVMPPPLGEHFNYWHQREGLRAAAVHLQEVTRR